MNILKTILCLSAFSIFLVNASADIMNGQFDSGLSDWDYNSGVDYALGYFDDPAVLFPLDDTLYSSILSQRFSVDGFNTLTFSYLADVQGGTEETDHFFASLLDSAYTTTESLTQSVDPGVSGIDPVPVSSSLVNYGIPANPYFYRWSSNPAATPEMTEGLVTSVTDADGWTTVSLLLPDGLDFATIRFELIHDHDPIDAVTAIFIDNVQLGNTAVVPIPGAVFLTGIGSFLVLSLRRKFNL